MIKAVAIKIGDKIYRGAGGDRHNHLYSYFGEDTFAGPHKQGFVDDKGKFYDRIEAAAHAFECKQTKKQFEALLSEDLW